MSVMKSIGLNILLFFTLLLVYTGRNLYLSRKGDRFQKGIKKNRLITE
jgi:hypothetical protein